MAESLFFQRRGFRFPCMREVISNINGSRVYSEEYIESLRQADRGKNNPLHIIAQKGAQERVLSKDVDIQICGGSRGGGKTAALLLEGIKDIGNGHFSSVIFRKEKDDFDEIKKQSTLFYAPFGTFNRSVNDLTWNFYSGGSMKFTYFSDATDEFKDRLRGRQYSYIGIDEITQIPYDKFKYLVTCNRNPFGIRNRILGTCNPDPDSWIRRFIDWWIGEDGIPIKERDGVIRYCFMDGITPDSIYWGSTREEVYEQCKNLIDPLWSSVYEELGFGKLTMFIKSATFCRAGLEENLILLRSSPEYVAGLAQQDEEQRARDLEGNWNFKNVGDDIIKQSDMEKFFNNPQVPEGTRRASIDIAFTGGDSLVMFLWLGYHIEDLFVCHYDSKSALSAVRAKLDEWGVLEENMVYDLNGIGQAFRGFFPRAVPFNNMAAVEEKHKNVYFNLKSQCAYLFAKKLRDGEMSINPRLLSLRFSGNGYKNVLLSQILMKERKAIRKDEKMEDHGFALIRKDAMKKIVGHSPDYMEALLMRMIFDVRNTTHHRPRGVPRYVQPR